MARIALPGVASGAVLPSDSFQMQDVRASARRPAVAWFAGTGFAAVLLILFADPLLCRRTFAGRDLALFFLPVEKAVHDAWARGQVPLWMPETSFGRSLAANPNTGAFYPVRILLSALPFPIAFKIFAVAHLWLAAAGTFRLARSRSISPWGSALAAMTYSLCGPAMSDIEYPDFLPGLALLPWLAFAAARLTHRPSGPAAAVFAALWGADLLAGDLFTAGLALVAALLIAWQESPRGGRGRGVARVAIASLPGVLLAGIQIVPAALFAPLTVRSLATGAVERALAWSVSLWRLLESVVPFPYGRPGPDGVVWGDILWSGRTSGFFSTLYAGVFAAGSLLIFRPEKGRRLFPLAFGAASIVLASVGYYLPAALARQRSILPVRYPEKLMVGAELALALVAGFGIDRLRKWGGRRLAFRPFLVAGALLLLASVSALGPAAAERAAGLWTSVPERVAAASRSLPGIFAAGGVWFLMLAAVWFLWTPPRGAWMPAVVALLVLTDLSWNVRRAIVTEPDELILAPPPSARAIVRANRGAAFRFTPLRDYVPPRRDEAARYLPWLDDQRNGLKGLSGTVFGVSYAFNIDYDLSDFYRVELARREAFRENSDWPGIDRYLASFSARSAIAERGQVFRGFPMSVRTLGASDWILGNSAALPSIRFAGRVEEVGGIDRAYRRIHDREVDLTDVTVVETGASRSESLSPGQVRLRRMEGERIDLETETPGPARLVLARAYSPFREVLVDGARTTDAPTNLCLTSVSVPAGRHSVSIRETLPGGRVGPLVSVVGAGWILVLGLRRRKPMEPVPLSPLRPE